MAETTEIRRVALVGGGVIGSGWAARCLAHGLDVVATDPGPGAEEKIRAGVANAWPALTKVGLKPGASQERLSFAKSLEAAVAEADFVQESAPENDDLKRKLHARIDAAARPAVVIASSSSGLLPSNFQADCKHPGAGAGRPSLQPGLHAAAGRSARRQEDLGGSHRYGDRLLQAHRHAPAEGRRSRCPAISPTGCRRRSGARRCI